MRVDLHIHTRESDGLLSVGEVIQLAHEHQVQILAITDHESTQGIAEAERTAQHYNIKIIPGVELLTGYHGQEVHLLGYFKNVHHPLLQARLSELREERTALAFDMVKCLQNDGLSLEWQDVEREVGAEGAVSKGHIMRALYHRNPDTSQAKWSVIANLFRPGGVAYLPFLKHAFEDAVDLIFAAGGLPVLAHPGLLHDPNIVFDLLAYRPIGLEVYYGYWEKQASLIHHYAQIAERFATLATGGSDFHGPFGPIRIGQVDVPLEGVLRLEEYLKMA